MFNLRHPLHFNLFYAFSNKHYKKLSNVQKYSSGIRQDSNSQSLDYECPPLTARPGLSPKCKRQLKVKLSLKVCQDSKCLLGGGLGSDQFGNLSLVLSSGLHQLGHLVISAPALEQVAEHVLLGVPFSLEGASSDY